ncbi:MAG: hypothetical protein E4G99_06860 [Anaerolineales bacterium]|nr:MAG: hypothetical protein E4G99_06860 [Anaerolineales bacterium]
MSKPNVVGVGTGYKNREGRAIGELCVVALVRQKIPRAGLPEEALVPAEVDGVPTDVVQVGHIKALAARTARWRPALGGVSIGHHLVTAGTLGSMVRDAVSGERLILSNNHVLANSNLAQIGDAILQPGRADSGQLNSDTFASLLRFEPIRFNESPATCDLALSFVRFGNALATLLGSKHRVKAYFSDPQASNQVDAALARPFDETELLDEILEIGAVNGSLPVELGMSVRKSGRTTGLTSGRIVVMDVTIDVDYGDASARFEDQFVTTPMSQPGDSGSLLVAGDALKAVGLLFAGSDQATIFNPIEHVQTALGITL